LIVQNQPLASPPYQIGTIEFPINNAKNKTQLVLGDPAPTQALQQLFLELVYLS